MILTGHEIKKRIEKGTIYISDFDEKRLNPNSYNLRLGDTLLVYDLEACDGVIDMKKNNPVKEIKIGEEGFVLEPGMLYLGRTMEITKTYDCVPMLEGRSSIGRLGMFCHVTAGFGDQGFEGSWTLEIATIHPLRVYAGTEICQISYYECKGEPMPYVSKKYLGQEEVVPSKLYMDFQNNK